MVLTQFFLVLHQLAAVAAHKVADLQRLKDLAVLEDQAVAVVFIIQALFLLVVLVRLTKVLLEAMERKLD